jgi:hypothetical protein
MVKHKPHLNINKPIQCRLPVKNFTGSLFKPRFPERINCINMLSLFINAKPRKTTLVFPNSQKLWTFFAMAEISQFRIESSKHAFTGRLQRNDIELAKQRLGASEL